MQSTLDPFSTDYTSARKRFREAAAQVGWNLEAHAIEARGPKGEELTIDVACSTPSDHANGLIVSSGLHGVEGFFGSAVQLSLLQDWAERRTQIPALNLIFIHALNPYGFAWLRRANEENTDLNRNFLLPGESWSRESPGYSQLDAFLNPPRPPSRWDFFLLKALLVKSKVPNVGAAIAAGQYEYPKGLFYGGRAPSRTQKILHQHLRRWIGAGRRVLHLDFHTGLGKYATWELRLENPPTPSSIQILEQCAGGHLKIAHSSGPEYRAQGTMGPWCANILEGVDYTYGCAEFGTDHPIKVLSRLRAENQAHHWGSSHDPATLRAKQRGLEAFCPTDRAWRSKVLEETDRMIELAIDALKNAPTTD
jgi:hypothetical protein